MSDEILDENLNEHLIHEGKGQLQITRITQYANKIRSIQIYINGKVVGSLKDGETKYFELDVRVYEVYAKIDWCATRPIKVTIHKDQRTSFELGCNVYGWKSLLAIFYYTFKTSEYLYLKQLS